MKYSFTFYKQYIFSFFVITLMTLQPLYAYDSEAVQNLVSGHTGPVRLLSYDEIHRWVLSAGDDGFLNVWDLEGKTTIGRFQVSNYRISQMALRPGKSECVILETDGIGLFRISVWDYELQKKLFSLRFIDSINYCAYSAKGTYLFILRNSSDPLVILEPKTGSILDISVSGLYGGLNFGATGNSERTIFLYDPGKSSASLGYYIDMDTGQIIQSVEFQANLSQPILALNNRFLVGIHNRVLYVFNAVTGQPVETHNLLENFQFVQPLMNHSLDRLYIYSTQAPIPQLKMITLSENGTITFKDIPVSWPQINEKSYGITGMTSIPEGLMVGTSEGQVFSLHTDRVTIFKSMEARSILDVSAGNDYLYVLFPTLLAKLPLNMINFKNDDAFVLEQTLSYSHIDARLFPILWNDTGSIAIEGPEKAPLLLYIQSLNMQGIKKVQALEDLLLLMDTNNSVFVIDMRINKVLLNYSGIGILDASLLDSERIIIGRSNLNQQSSLLQITIATGETLPILSPYRAVNYLSESYNSHIYGFGVLDQLGQNQTDLFYLQANTENPLKTVIKYNNEDFRATIAECQGSLLTNLGGEVLSLLTSSGFTTLTPGSAFPKKLISSDKAFIVLDNDGAISWISPSGNNLGTLVLYENKWVLRDYQDGKIISGPLIHL